MKMSNPVFWEKLEKSNLSWVELRQIVVKVNAGSKYL